MDKRRNDLIDKIRALLSKTPDRGASESEAIEALKMANKLLLKHGLSMAEVGDVGVPAGGWVVQEWTTMRAAGQGRKGVRTGKPGWQGNLAAAIGQSFFVKVLFASKSGAILFVGRPDNIAVVRELHEWTVNQVTRLALRACKGSGRNPVYEPTWMRSCRLGMVNRIGERVADAVAEAQSQDVKITALVVQYAQENKTYIADKIKFVETRDRRDQYDSVAAAVGYQAGNRVSINPASRQVAGGGEVRELR